MNVKIIKLTNSDEVIADVKESDDDKVILSNPAKIVMFPGEDGGMGLALVPWLPYSDDEEVEIKEKDILVVVTPSSEIFSEYNGRFGSGLIIPDDGIIKLDS